MLLFKSNRFSFLIAMQTGRILLRSLLHKGLYAGERVRVGETVSEFGNRNRRTWKPNAQKVLLYSETLKERLLLRVTTTALQKIDEAGGLDAYILGQRHPESMLADKLKRRILMHRWEAEKAQNAVNGGGLFAAG